MDLDFPGMGVGMGLGVILGGLLMYLAVLALSIWIFYLIVRAAVTSGIMRAAKRGAFQSTSSPYHAPPGPGGPQGQVPVQHMPPGPSQPPH